ncbi:MAG: hypothetical protein AB7F75_01405 [Planctomycetota bacterium]
MWFRRKTPGPYDHLSPEQGPPEGSEIRSASTPLMPTMGRILSRDGVEGDVVWLSVSRTFANCPPSTPWAMTIGLLKELDKSGIITLPSAFISHRGALPGLEQASAGLPPLRLDFRLESLIHVPEDDDACYGSTLNLTWFCEEAHAWLTPFREAAKKSLDWKKHCQPMFRDSPRRRNAPI